MKTEREEIEKHICLIEIGTAMILEWIVEGNAVEEEIGDVIVEEISEIGIGMTEGKGKTEKIAKEIHKIKAFRCEFIN